MHINNTYTKIAFLMISISLFTINLLSQNPSSTNYTLQQWGFATGNDTADKPESTNYILSGSSIGIISGDDTNSTNYKMIPGYYLGLITGDIIPPENVIISVMGGNVNLTWDAVTGASSYTVYSSDDPNLDVSLWDEEQTGISVTNWSEAISEAKKFYYITANTVIRTHLSGN